MMLTGDTIALGSIKMAKQLYAHSAELSVRAKNTERSIAATMLCGWPLLFAGLFHHLVTANLLGIMLGPVVLSWWLGAYAVVFAIAFWCWRFSLKAQLQEGSEGLPGRPAASL